MTEDIFEGKPEEPADARPMTRAEKAVRVANIALHYIAGTHGLQEWRGKEQATEALAKMTDILGTPPENDPDATIEALRHRVGVMEKSILLQEEQYRTVVKERSEWRSKFFDETKKIGELEAERDRWKASVHEVQGRLEDAVRQADAATRQASIEAGRVNVLQETLGENVGQSLKDSDFIEYLQARLYIYEAAEAYKKQQLKTLNKRGKL